MGISLKSETVTLWKCLVLVEGVLFFNFQSLHSIRELPSYFVVFMYVYYRVYMHKDKREKVY